jgi:hypothetical protein
MLHRVHVTTIVLDKYVSATQHFWKARPTLIDSPSRISLLQWDTRVRSFCWLILFTLCMHGIETVTLLAYVEFVLRLCMQYVGNGRAKKGQSIELGGVGEAGAIGWNSTSPPPGSASTIDTAVALGPNGTSTSASIGTLATPGHNGTSTSAGISISATPGGDATSSSAAGRINSGSVEPFRPRPRPPLLILPVEMTPLRLVLIEQDESHDLKWSVLLWLQQGWACL